MRKKFIRDLKEIITELGFTQRWAEIEMWHTIGKRINDEPDFKPSQMRELAQNLGLPEDDLWDAVIFYKQYPSLDSFPSGKNISWTKIKDEI